MQNRPWANNRFAPPEPPSGSEKAGYQKKEIPGNQSNLKVFITYSPSHKYLAEIFTHSFNKVNTNAAFELYVTKIPEQKGKAEFYTEGWFEMVLQKVRNIRKFMDAVDDDEIVVYSDVDIIFARDFSSEIYELMRPEEDILFQREHFDSDTICSGFMLLRKTGRIMALLDCVAADIVEFGTGDQHAFNKFKRMVNYGCLPHRYFNISHVDPEIDTTWEGDIGKLPTLPDDVAIVHANWTIGNGNKMLMMNHYVNCLIKI